MENNCIEKYIGEFAKNKPKIVLFVMAVISLICSCLYVSSMNLFFIPSLFAFAVILVSLGNIVYCLDAYKKNKYANDIIVLEVVIMVIVSLLRTIQLGLLVSWVYFAAYFLYSLLFSIILLYFAKTNKGKTFIFILSVILILFNLYEFIFSNLVIRGFFWKIYHISEALIIAQFALIIFETKERIGEFSEKLGKYKMQIPSLRIFSAAVCVIAAVALGIGLLTSLNDNGGKKNTVKRTVSVTEQKDIGSEGEKEEKTEKKSTVEKTEKSETEQKSNSVVENKDEELPISLGQMVNTKNYDFTLNKVELSYEVKPDNPPSYYTYYRAEDGHVYIYVNATIKNTGEKSLKCDEIYSVTATYDGKYKYDGFAIASDHDGDFTYANITTLDPLQTNGVHVLVDCPEEVATSGKPLFITIKQSDGTKYVHTIR